MALSRSFVRIRARALTIVAGIIAFSALAADADAFAVKKTPGGDFVHWDEPAVRYTFDPSVAANVIGAVPAATLAMDSWSGTVGAPELHGQLASAIAAPPLAPGYDSKNGVFFMPNGFAPAGKALAITVLTYDNSTGQILDADIIVNGIYKFAVLANGANGGLPDQVSGAHPSNTDGVSHEDATASIDTVYDLHHVVAHELGHSLGMNDELVHKGSLMYRYSSPNDASVRAPENDDILGLAELYSTKIEAGGNGCGNAAVAPKRPSLAASQLAMFATFGFLMFLVLRGRSDRRARFAFVAAAAIAAYALVPTVSKSTAGVARASDLAPGQARAKVLGTSVTMEAGLLKTSYQLATTACRATSCPKLGQGIAWGGTAGNIRQEVGGQFAPVSGDDVDVSFDTQPDALAPLARPLGGTSAGPSTVRVLTRAN